MVPHRIVIVIVIILDSLILCCGSGRGSGCGCACTAGNSGGGCPVKHQNTTTTTTTMTGGGGGCPVKHSSSSSISSAANSNDDLHQSNYIPRFLAQSPAPGQMVALDLQRQISTIPKSSVGASTTTAATTTTATPTSTTGTTTAADAAKEERWVYPSEQQFYNALQRKGYETDEQDIPMIVSIHNEMNEQCWQEILRWEKASTRYVSTWWGRVGA